MVTYPIAINLQVPDDVTLPSGMTASVIVTVNRKTDVIVVPDPGRPAPGPRPGRRSRDADQGTEMRPVQVGMANDQQTEITSGLARARR